jgi:hypothetical protein
LDLASSVDTAIGKERYPLLMKIRRINAL